MPWGDQGSRAALALALAAAASASAAAVVVVVLAMYFALFAPHSPRASFTGCPCWQLSDLPVLASYLFCPLIGALSGRSYV